MWSYMSYQNIKL